MSEVKKINPIHYVICAAFCLLFRFIPPVLGLTELGMGIIGTFIGAVYGWILIDMLWPSMLALLGIGLSIGMDNMMAGSFGSLTVVALIVCMMAVGAAMKNGAFSWMAMKLLTSKALAGKGYLTIFLIMMIAWITGSFNPIVMCLIFCAFLTSMFKQVGVQKNDPLVLFTFIGVAYQLMRGQILFPFMGTGLTYMMSYNNMFPDLPMPTGSYLIMMVSMGLIMAVVYIMLMKFVFRVDVSPLANYKREGGVPPATKGQKTALVIFALFLITMILSVFGPAPVRDFLAHFGIVGITIVFGVLVPLLKDEKGQPVGKLQELLSMCDWGQITMMGYIMVVSGQMMLPETGISKAIACLFQPFMGLPPMVFIVVVMILATILTNVANNVLVTVLCMPFLVSFGTSIGMNPVGMVCLLFIISEFALATPAASPVTAVAFSQEMVTSTAMTKTALKVLVPLFIVFLLVAWPLQALIF